ncbi:alpha/beta fold hydrolase [Effusibacillus consociatus]|uniref:Alpha/beta fold hydrolase n=1 Tax=Effusibacillus consociatus TaxID=1117041 RepID=A0ABV9PX45_9BACL
MPFVKAGDIQIHYQEKGNGPEAILFIHGNIGSWRWWEKVMDLLTEEYRSFALDSRGCGFTDKPETGHSIRQFADDVEAFAQALNINQFTLVGHSLGGGTAMQYAIAYPHRVKRLILLDPVPAEGLVIPEEFHPLFKQWQEDKESLKEALKGTAPTYSYNEFFDQLVEEAFTASKQVFEGNIKALAEMDVSGHLREITAPALVIWGELDNWSPLDGIQRIHQAIPGSRLEVVPGVGHSLNVENPKRFVDLVTDFCKTTQ